MLFLLPVGFVHAVGVRFTRGWDTITIPRFIMVFVFFKTTAEQMEANHPFVR